MISQIFTQTCDALNIRRWLSKLPQTQRNGRFLLQVTGHRLQVTGHRSQVTGCRSQVAGHRSHQNQKASSDTGDVRVTRDSQEVPWTKVSLYNFTEKFLGVVYVLNGLKYRYKIIHYDSKLNFNFCVFENHYNQYVLNKN